MRGAEFEKQEYKFGSDPHVGWEPSDGKSVKIADDALHDVARWLGFGNASDVYVDVLQEERRAIFKRARRPRATAKPKARALTSPARKPS